MRALAILYACRATGLDPRNVQPLTTAVGGGSATLHRTRYSPARGSSSIAVPGGYFSETQIGAALALDRYLTHAFPSARVCRPTLDWSRHPPNLWGLRAVGDVVTVGSRPYRVALLGPHCDPSIPIYGYADSGRNLYQDSHFGRGIAVPVPRTFLQSPDVQLITKGVVPREVDFHARINHAEILEVTRVLCVGASGLPPDLLAALVLSSSHALRQARYFWLFSVSQMHARLWPTKRSLDARISSQHVGHGS